MEHSRINKRHSGKKIKTKVFFSFVVLAATVWGYQLYVKRFAPATSHLQDQVIGAANVGQNPVSTSSNASPSVQSVAKTPTLPATTTMDTQTTIAAKSAPTLSKLKINDTPTGYLNVRDQPSLTGVIITKVYPQAVYPYTTITNGWYLITLPDGHKGWVNGQYLAAQ